MAIIDEKYTVTENIISQLERAYHLDNEYPNENKYKIELGTYWVNKLLEEENLHLYKFKDEMYSIYGVRVDINFVDKYAFKIWKEIV